MALKTIPIDRVVVGDRLRATGKEQVDKLMGSIREVGLINPITVGEETEDGYPLVAGLHRLEACQRLGHAEIDAHIVSMPDLRRQLVEVDENLAHTVLTSAQRAIFTAKRKEIYLALYPATANGGDRRSENIRTKTFRSGPDAGEDSGKAANEKNSVARSDSRDDELTEDAVPKVRCFTVDTAQRTGRLRRIVEIDAQRGTNIPHDVLEMIVGTDFDRGKSLNAIARMMPVEQGQLCDHIRAGRLIEARRMVDAAQHLKVVQLPGNCTKEVRKQLARLDNAWGLASDDARARFARKLDKRGDLRKYGLTLSDIVG